MYAIRTFLTYIIVMLLLIGSQGCSDSESDNNGPSDTGDVTDTTEPDADDDIVEAMQLRIDELDGPASVRIDDQGVPHARCSTNADCFAVQGYFHASQRFSQMDLRRRLARGRLSTLLTIQNADVLTLDKSSRLRLTSRDGEPLEEVAYQTLDTETREALEAYTRGVNAFLADYREGENGAQLSEEYDFALINGDDIPDWEPQDSIAAGLLLLSQLVDTGGEEQSAGANREILDQDLYLDMFLGWHLDPDSTIIEASGETYDELGSLSDANLMRRFDSLRDLRLLMERARPALLEGQQLYDVADRLLAPGPLGSNSWATAPSRNSQDFAVLSNDPHLALTNPSMWHLMHLDAKSDGTGDLHAAGATFAGVPGIMVGYNEEVAWSATVAYWDLTDVYVEELTADGEGVVFNGNDVPFTKKTFTFERPGDDVQEEFLWVPHHGPVLSVDEDANVAISMKSILQESTTDLEFFVNVGRVGSMEDAREHFRLSQASAFSFTLIDRSGNIAYFPYAELPRRDWDTTTVPAWAPIPGTGEYEWGAENIDDDELPQLLNPPNGFIATANAGITDDMLDGLPGNAGYPPLQTVSMAPGIRQGRIVDMIADFENNHGFDSHAAMQADNYSLLGALLVNPILTIADSGIDVQGVAVQQALRDWDYTCPSGLSGSDPTSAPDTDQTQAAAGCAAFHITLAVLTNEILGDELQLAYDQSRTTSELELVYWLLVDDTELRGGPVYWDNAITDFDETPAVIVSAALGEAEIILEDKFGSAEPSDWHWGQIHTMTLQADLLSSITPQFNNGPYATPGGRLTVDVANPSSTRDGSGEYSHRSGASMRMVVEGRSEGMVGHFQLPGGQIHRRDSPHYDDLLQKWLEHEYFTMPFTMSEVNEAAQTTYEVRSE